MKKRSKGKRIVKENPIYKKDVMNTSTTKTGIQGNATNAPMELQGAVDKSQTMTSSVTDRFSKELGQHGYLKHTNKTGPQNYQPPSKTIPENPYESTTQSEEPYRREAGKLSLGGTQPSSHRNDGPQTSNTYENSRPSQQYQNDRKIGSRGMNRRLVEENIIRNASAERGFNPDASKLYDAPPDVNQSFQHRHSDSLDARIQKHYDERSQIQQPVNNEPSPQQQYNDPVRESFDQGKYQKFAHFEPIHTLKKTFAQELNIYSNN